MIVDLAIERLSDKSSTVRKRAIQLLLEVLKTHPFSVDGGVLPQGFIEKRINEVSKELESLAPPEIKQIIQDEDKDKDVAMEESSSETNVPENADESKIGSLLLLKKYYTDCLAFIKQIHSSLEVVFQLLCSVNKTEVIEAIDYILTCHVYKVEVANVKQSFKYRSD